MSKKLTANAGCPVVDNQNVMTAGPRGPQLLRDVWFLEKLAHFDREVIPERRMHAKGSGAYGTYTTSRNTRGPGSSPRSAGKPSCSRASPRSRASAARPMPSATSAASRSSPTPRKATGTISKT